MGDSASKIRFHELIRGSLSYAANKNNLSASLLVVQSYQESHRDRKAKSLAGINQRFPK